MITIRDLCEQTAITRQWLGVLIKRNLQEYEDYIYINTNLVLTDAGVPKFESILQKIKPRKNKKPYPEKLEHKPAPVPADIKVSLVTSMEIKEANQNTTYMNQLNALPLQKQPETIKKKFMANLRLNPAMRDILFN